MRRPGLSIPGVLLIARLGDNIGPGHTDVSVVVLGQSGGGSREQIPLLREESEKWPEQNPGMFEITQHSQHDTHPD